MKTKKFLSVLLTLLMVITTLTACGKKGDLVDGTYTGSGKGYGGKVTVTLTVKKGVVKEAKIEGPDETPGVGGKAIPELEKAIVDAQSADIDVVTSATFTSNGVIEAARSAFEQAKTGVAVADVWENVPVSYTAGTYTGVAEGYNGPVTLNVTFAEDGIEAIEVESKETDHVGTTAFDYLIADAKEANGSGIDMVSGATFTSRAFKAALTEAAKAANASDIDGFEKNTVVHNPQADKDLGTFDVIVVGAGGAGMGAAAQAAQNGLSVLVVEENAEIGGNTLVSGGQFQAVMPYLVWDAANPDATEAVWDYNGQTYQKVKASQGQLDTLKVIANWSEEAFDEHYFDDKTYVPGEIDLVCQAGVHAEYLPTLKALKEEINAYVKWADAKIAQGVAETDLALFSTVNLHIFQTYYGGLRQNADHTKWIYGDFDLVNQFCSEGYDLKVWLEDQGTTFNDAAAITLIGALWYRENINTGCNLEGVTGSNNWKTYFAPTLKTLLETSDTAANNKVVVRTKVDSLVVEDGRVVGINATEYDGTKVTARANGGVVLATGGYAANVNMVVENNDYWSPEAVTTAIKTTNRNSLQGDGIVMATAIGAGTTGMDFAQMMPISWIDNGNLAFGNGLYATYINPTTGTRFVDESAERDVLSLGEFANGVDVNGVKGVFMEITNANTPLTYPYPYDKYEGTKLVELGTEDVKDRVYYFSSQEELKAIMDQYGMSADPADVYATIEQYDKDMKAGETSSAGVLKMQHTSPIGEWNGDNYTLDGVRLRVRLMAPSTHHTMGGLTVDLDRHVLDAKGVVIPGLYAAGEVTGGIHAGNRLGGNAIVEIFVSGRTAANTITNEMPAVK